MFTSYRRILAHPGALRFSLTGLVARLPISMVGLGIVLLVSAATGSYGVAGAVSAAYMLANAVFSILQGRLIDTLGQARVLGIASAAFGVSTAMLVWSVQADWPIVTSYVFAALGGATLPQVGSAVRARWSYVLDQPADVQTAYALEAVADEAVFILGPIIVTVLATTWHPVAGVAVAIVACVAGTWGFCAQRSTEPPAQPHARADGRAAAAPVAHGHPARDRLRRSRHPLRRRRGDHGRVRRRAGAPGLGRRPARAVGVRQSLRRRHLRRRPLAPRSVRAGALGRVRDGLRDVTPLLRRLVGR